MTFEQKGKDPLIERITVRLTVEEKSQIKEDADIAGLAINELVRCQIFKRPIVVKEDRVFVKGQHRILMELRRVGGLLKRVHIESGGSYSNETSEALREVKAATASVRTYMEILVDGR